MSEINVSPEKPPVFSVEYAAAVMLASKRNGAVVEYWDNGWRLPSGSPLWKWRGVGSCSYRILPGSIIGSREWLEKLPVGTKFTNPKWTSPEFWERTTTGFRRSCAWAWVQEKTVSEMTDHFDDWIILPAEPEPVKHSREWARLLPADTEVWSPCLRPTGFESISSQNVVAGGPWYIVGSPEWANALPEGTKVRSRSWHPLDYVTRSGNRWSFQHGSELVGLGLLDGLLELYTAPAPAPLWSCAADVPVEAADGWFKFSGSEDIYRLTAITVRGIECEGDYGLWGDIPNWSWSRTHLGPFVECRVGSEKEVAR